MFEYWICTNEYTYLLAFHGSFFVYFISYCRLIEGTIAYFISLFDTQHSIKTLVNN